jgi:hypothetical protein
MSADPFSGTGARVWVFLKDVLFHPKEVLKEKIRLSAEGSEHTGAEVLELMRQHLPIFPS